jgi:hypothetical protein
MLFSRVGLLRVHECDTLNERLAEREGKVLPLCEYCAERNEKYYTKIRSIIEIINEGYKRCEMI